MIHAIRHLFNFAVLHTGTEVSLGIEPAPEKVTDWLPVMSIVLAAFVCLVALIAVLCTGQTCVSVAVLNGEQTTTGSVC